MKASVVAILAALAAIRSAGAKLRGQVAAHFVVSEEDGLGAFGTLERGHTGDACIITEPTSGTLMTGDDEAGVDVGAVTQHGDAPALLRQAGVAPHVGVGLVAGAGRATATTRRVSASMMTCTFAENR
ncbi:acetylornithine deacetylase/succinyl-diaminopimelate desuccinylase-like protein [Streptomyces stelliscabiei]|uniref:Acetylornithine deacetylase/succinyl-diaminopimelate desuccinylase-like protein n=1 Tax=Streptomyces stelliscabiei TaxID=146820 RepID=A0A8I0TQC6_9ACTN|nr:acetylornithine deacetylase/succinyl-diaminopimelate desuccinylase-like protein [Streptomyces stelliscabiei]